MTLVEQRAEVVPVTAACEALGSSRASLYRPTLRWGHAPKNRGLLSARSSRPGEQLSRGGHGPMRNARFDRAFVLRIVAIVLGIGALGRCLHVPRNPAKPSLDPLRSLAGAARGFECM